MSNNSAAKDRFENYIEEALQQAFKGWDFSFLNQRTTEEPIPWDYPEIARQKMNSARAVLDMGTGGGELLASLQPFPEVVVATEGYRPNIPVAGARLQPLQATVVGVDEGEQNLPFAREVFDLVLNRHESFNPLELARVQTPGGIFLTQQVGGRDNIRLNGVLQDQASYRYEDCLCADAVRDLEQAGFEIVQHQEAFPEVIFHDIGAVVFYLRVISWQIADFSVERYRQKLYDLHLQIEREGGFCSHSHRFLIEARKPG